MKKNPIKYSLAENDIKQINIEDINDLNDQAKFSHKDKKTALKLGTIIRFGRGSYHKINVKLLEWYGH